MKVLSLFDGMACGMIAMQNAGITVDRYVAYEIDKYAIQTATHNFPMIEECGDVFEADFTQYEGFDWVMAGFPCTKFSIAQKNDRETVPYSGEGWDLFEQAWRAVCEAKPRFFLLENNKSMALAVQQEISKIIGFEPVLINSALVSAQNRQRLYWVGKRNPDGTYSRVRIEQPKDRGILLKDILEDGMVDKEKRTVLNTKLVMQEIILRSITPKLNSNQLISQKMANRKPSKRNIIKNSVANFCGYTSTYGATGVAEPVRIPEYGVEDKSRPITAGYSHKGSGEGSLKSDAFPDNPNKQVFDYVAEPLRVGALPRPNGELSTSQAFRVYSTDGKSVNITAGGGGAEGKTGLYAIPIEFDGDIPTKAISAADGKTYTVYDVKDGQITIKDKQYPIKLADGYYIIRKLTVRECMRLQTVPEWYEFPVSDSQAYKMLGNGWTCDVITHLINATMVAQSKWLDELLGGGE